MDRDGSVSRRARWDGILASVALVGILAILLAPPHGLLDKADHAAYAVCHRISERTFIFAGRPLPLCARCSGTYLGALAGLIVLILRGRGRAADLPGRRYLAVFAGFVLLWAVDGLNSYLTFFPGLPPLYQPHNILRLATGTLEGLAIAAFLLPILNLSLWAAPVNTPSVASWRDLAWMLAGGALVVGLVSSEWPPLLYPLALISGATVVALVGSVNAMFGLVLLRREGRARRWREAIAPIAIGAALATVELAAIATARAALTARLGLPF
ncbi:MAG: hypothetical protein CVU38_12950 [Chloroflexi bacterium HGW-Chloroflexi-1]|nr:MAG: hypothetical protein CVU38_12950 [Chloroflexi bacterium HGW-Chloroflexi-1]